jgi:purine nucleosidase
MAALMAAPPWQARRGAPVVIDTDCGVDDATGLLVAFNKHSRGEIELRGITCVHGNADLGDVLRNVAAVKAAHGRVGAVPVFKGAQSALITPTAPGDPPFHGSDGLGDTTDRGTRGAQHPDVPAVPAGALLHEEEHAANAIVRLARAQPGELLLIALGPLTNIALALRLEPQLPQLVAGFVFMGGTSRGSGNVTPVAEANFHYDPDAAAVCLQEFNCSVMLSWEVTRDHPLPWPWLDQTWFTQETELGKFMTAVWGDISRKVRGNEAGMLIPDPLAVIAALDVNGKAGVVLETELVR